MVMLNLGVDVKNEEMINWKKVNGLSFWTSI